MQTSRLQYAADASLLSPSRTILQHRPGDNPRERFDATHDSIDGPCVFPRGSMEADSGRVRAGIVRPGTDAFRRKSAELYPSRRSGRDIEGRFSAANVDR